MGICSSANATPPSIVDLEGEVEAGAEDNVSGTSKPTNTREAEEEERRSTVEPEVRVQVLRLRTQEGLVCILLNRAVHSRLCINPANHTP